MIPKVTSTSHYQVNLDRKIVACISVIFFFSILFLCWRKKTPPVTERALVLRHTEELIKMKVFSTQITVEEAYECLSFKTGDELTIKRIKQRCQEIVDFMNKKKEKASFFMQKEMDKVVLRVKAAADVLSAEIQRTSSKT